MPSIHFCLAMFIILLPAFVNASATNRKTLNRLRLRETRNGQTEKHEIGNHGDISRRPHSVRNMDDTVRSSKFKHAQNVTDGAFQEFYTNSSSLSGRENVTESNLKVFATNASLEVLTIKPISVSHKDNVPNSTLEIVGTNFTNVSSNETVRNSILEVASTNVTPVSTNDSGRDFTLDIAGRNVTPVLTNDSVRDSPLDVVGTKVTSLLSNDNVTDSILEIVSTNIQSASSNDSGRDSTLEDATNFTNVPSNEDLQNSILEVTSTNVTSVSANENVKNSTLEIVGTNFTSVSSKDNMGDSTLEVVGANVTALLSNDSVSDSTLEVVNTNITSVSLQDSGRDSTLEVVGSNVSFMPSNDNVTHSTLGVVTTNVRSQSSNDNVTTLEIVGTNATLLSSDDNVTGTTLEIVATNATLLSSNDNVTDTTLEIVSTNSTSLSSNDNVTGTTLEIVGTHISSMSRNEKETYPTFEASGPNEDLFLRNVTNYKQHLQEIHSKGTQNINFDNNVTNNNYNNSSNLKYSNFKSNNSTPVVSFNNAAPSDYLDNSEDYVDEDDHGSWNNDYHSSHSNGENNSSDSDHSESDCVTCRIRAIDKHYRIMQFKNHILNTLHITNMPNTTGVPIPKFPALTHLYEMEADLMNDAPSRATYRSTQDDDDIIVKTERVFIAGKEAPLALHLNLTDTVYFPPAVQLFTSDLKSAHLWFYIHKHAVPPSHVTIEKIIPQSKPGKTFITNKVFSIKLPKNKAFGWKRVDLKDILRQWIRHPMTNFGLQIKALDNSGNNLIVVPPAPDIDKGYEPWLDTKITESKHNSRRKRSESLMCVENSTDTRCCRHPLLVGFAEFGWDWIIAPTHVNADYCTGECRMTMQDNTPYSWVNQNMAGTNSCCTPTKLSPLPLLYFDESMNIVYQILQNMKVDKCGCA